MYTYVHIINTRYCVDIVRIQLGTDMMPGPRLGESEVPAVPALLSPAACFVHGAPMARKVKQSNSVDCVRLLLMTSCWCTSATHECSHASNCFQC